MSNPVRTEKARLAANVRHHPNKDHTENRRDLAAAKLDAYIEKILAAAPPLTDEQRTKLAELLRPVRQSGGGV